MGIYINPPTMTKEEWLLNNHTTIRKNAPEWNEIPRDTMVVCLIDNGPFTAAGVCYSERELNDFADENDTRPKAWITVKKEKLITLIPELDDL